MSLISYSPAITFPQGLFFIVAVVLYRIVIFFLYLVGLADSLDSSHSPPLASQMINSSCCRPMSATMLMTAIPAVSFDSNLEEDGTADSCAVSLHEFEENEEVCRLINCRHVFHACRCCLEPWADLGRHTCPFCRAPLVTQEAGLGACPEWLGSEFYVGNDGDYYLILDESMGFLSLPGYQAGEILI